MRYTRCCTSRKNRRLLWKSCSAANKKPNNFRAAIDNLDCAPRRKSQAWPRILFTKFSDCRRVQLVLGNLNPGMQAFRGIVRQDGYLPASDDLAVIDFVIDIMHRAARHSFTGSESWFPSFKSRIFRQERRMDVDDALGNRPEHGCVQYAHEASEDHKMNASVAQNSHKLFFCLR